VGAVRAARQEVFKHSRTSAKKMQDPDTQQKTVNWLNRAQEPALGLISARRPPKIKAIFDDTPNLSATTAKDQSIFNLAQLWNEVPSS
jgi:hypothetical protein